MCGNPQAISQFHNSPLKNIDVQIPHKMWIRLVLCDFSLELILMELLLSKHSYFIFLLLFVNEKVLKKLPCAVFLLSTHGGVMHGVIVATGACRSCGCQSK